MRHYAAALAILLAVSTPFAAGTPPADAAAPACPPDVDLSVLIEALTTTGLRVAQDGAAMLEAYRDERDALCRRLDARGAMLEAMRESLDLTRQMLDLERGNRKMYQTDLEAALKRKAPAGKRWFGCGPGGQVGFATDGQTVGSAGVGCLLILWP